MIHRRALFPLLLATLSGCTFSAARSPGRLSYGDSCLLLQKLGYIPEGTLPNAPGRLPTYADPAPWGVNFFRVRVENERLENLTLQRTFFGRSAMERVSFRNTDFSESNLTWNDFTDVDFSQATLLKADLRCSDFVNVRFEATDLRNADLRRSAFEKCSFSGANLSGAIANFRQQPALGLSSGQLRQMTWTDDEGAEPSGG